MILSDRTISVSVFIFVSVANDGSSVSSISSVLLILMLIMLIMLIMLLTQNFQYLQLYLQLLLEPLKSFFRWTSFDLCLCL
jgi:hypothetical protein